jgi:hypothetical protein
VRKLTQSEFGIALSENDEIDPAAAKLYDGIFLWARALSRVFANNGAPVDSNRLTFGAIGDCMLAVVHMRSAGATNSGWSVAAAIRWQEGREGDGERDGRHRFPE